MKTDIEIAQSCPLLPITAIGAKLGLTEEQLECYGRYKAKLLPSATVGKPQTGKLILVTAINPTAAGEGKTTTSIGLADSLSALGKKTVLALREPSLGPVFGLKGGATGGGWAQVAPMEDINLTLPATSTPSVPPTTCWRPWWITTSIRATLWTSNR